MAVCPPKQETPLVSNFRQQEILELARRQGRVSVDDLAAQYDVTVQTIRRDLTALTKDGQVSRVHGGKLKAKKEIRIASLFKDAAPEFLEMIVVHELAHLKEHDHNKAFYKLCTYMLPNYHQREFDMRVYLTAKELGQI